MSDAGTATQARSARLASEDALLLDRYYTRSVERSTFGAQMDHGKYNFGAIRDAARLGKCEPPGGTLSEPWPVVVGGAIVRSDHELTAQPRKLHGDHFGGGAEFDEVDTLGRGTVSRVLARMARVLLMPDVTARDVFDVIGHLGGDMPFRSLAHRGSVPDLCFVTAPGRQLVAERRGAADGWPGVARAHHKLTEQEVAFVGELDLQHGERGRFAAERAGYPLAECLDVAETLMRKPGVLAALDLRRQAARLAGLWDHQVYADPQAAAVGSGKHVRRLRTAAEADAVALLASACSAWNAARGARAA